MLMDFMIILRNCKLILTIYNLIHITSKKLFLVLININYRIFSQIFHAKSKNSNILFDDLYNISGNLKKFEGFECNLRNFNSILKKFKEMYIFLT
jgi:hypothetical protein